MRKSLFKRLQITMPFFVSCLRHDVSSVFTRASNKGSWRFHDCEEVSKYESAFNKEKTLLCDCEIFVKVRLKLYSVYRWLWAGRSSSESGWPCSPHGSGRCPSRRAPRAGAPASPWAGPASAASPSAARPSHPDWGGCLVEFRNLITSIISNNTQTQRRSITNYRLQPVDNF